MPKVERAEGGSGQRWAHHALTQSQEVLRAALLIVLGAGARHLPRSMAYGLYDGVRSMLALSPLGVRARQVMRATFPAQSAEIGPLTEDWLGRPFRDHVNAVRITSGREDMRDWTVTMRGAPDLLREPEQSFIIATGHFSREAMGVLYAPWLVPFRLATVVAPMVQAKTPRAFRVRQQMRELRKGIELVRDGDVDIADVAGNGFLMRLLRHLRAPGGVVVIAADAAWHGDKEGGHTRPFAAYASQSFHLGTARLARLSQRPIVTCVPFLDHDRRVIVEWSPVIMPPARDDAEADVRITNEILDWLERRIGERPDQYVLSFGKDRRWSPTAKCWIGAESEPKPAAPVAPKLETRDA